MNATRRRRRFRRVVVSVCLLLIVAVITGLPVYVRPQVDRPRHADAIFILGGPDHRRYSFGFELGAQGWAPNVVVSNPNGADDPWLTRFCATPQPRVRPALLCPGPADDERRRARATSFGFATRLADSHRCHVAAPYFPGPVHPGEVLRR